MISWVWSIQLALTLDLVSVTNRRLHAASIVASAERPLRAKGERSGEKVMSMAASMHSSGDELFERPDYYSQINKIRNYFDQNGSGATDSDFGTSRKQSSFGEPLGRVPSVAIFKALPHFPAAELPDDHIGLRDRFQSTTTGRSLSSTQPVPVDFLSRESNGRASQVAATAIPFVGGAEDIISPSGSLGRSMAVPIITSDGFDGHYNNNKISGSYRADYDKTSPIMNLHRSSPVNPITWSPAKMGNISPSMSPFRSRADSEEG